MRYKAVRLDEVSAIQVEVASENSSWIRLEIIL